MKIIIWSKYNKSKDKYEHNHIESLELDEGLDYPKPIDIKYKNQNNWKMFKWKKEYGELLNNKVLEG